MKKILIYSVTAIAVFGLCGISIASVKANTGSSDYPSIIQKLVERFNLNADDVKQVFDEMKQERQQGMQARFGERPAPQELTDEQKEALAAKQEELRGEYDVLKDLSPKEKQAKMEEIRGEMKAWAEENGIDFAALNCFGGRFDKGFGRGFVDFGPKGNQ